MYANYFLFSHTFFRSPDIFVDVPIGLQVNSGKTLSLIGGDIDLPGGNITSVGGNIFLGAIGEKEFVGLNFVDESKFRLDYQQVKNFKNVTLNNALININDTESGSIEVQAQNINLSNDSNINSQILSNGLGGNIILKSEDSIKLTESSILNFSLAEGETGNISIKADKIELTNGSEIGNVVFGSGNSGDVLVLADSIKIDGINESDPSRISTIGTTVAPNSTASGGNVDIQANNILLSNLGNIQASTSGDGNAGNLFISASNIDLIGGTSTRASGIATITFPTSSGNGGNLFIKTDNLSIAEGAKIISTTAGTGAGGQIDIQSIQTNLSDDGSSIAADAIINTGNGGNINISTSILNIDNKATVSAGNFFSNPTFPPGQGSPGSISVKAKTISLNEASISVDTISGEEGNIFLDADNIRLDNLSRVSTNAELSNGGNIVINANTLLGINNSDITANTVRGNGGNIDIRANALLGINKSARLTPQSDITASSDLGIDGTVTINSPETNADDEILLAPIRQEETPVEIVRNICSEGRFDRDNRLTITAKSPYDDFYKDLDYTDEYAIKIQEILRDSKNERNTQSFDNSSSWQPGEPIIEPNAVETAPNGEIMLVANNQPQIIASSELCQRDR